MSEINELLQTLHELNQWVVVVVGAISLGIASAGFFGGRAFRRIGRRALGGFLAVLGAQIGLGVAIAVTAETGSEPFDGNTGTLVWHALGGVLAITFAAIALMRMHRRPTERTAARTAVIWSALALVSVGNIVIGMAVAVGVAVFRLLTTRRLVPDSLDDEDRRLTGATR